ncbi:unnamed protein product [Somion occarium]|uniref:histone deacetylase n=1 Tax=Somion occarium TaxID=3059160 RepID=A0ABP1CW31_9APHY
MSQRRVSYYYDPDVGAYTYGPQHPMRPQRMKITHELVSVYGMLDKMTVLRAKRATAEQMTRFHTDEYVDFLARIAPELTHDVPYHGSYPMALHEDNPPWEGLFEFCSLSAGGSIAASQRIASGATDIAINWAGGLHHAKKREASGFCYINDIVLGILEMLRVFPRVLYIDIDCHHGDGVEEAFYTTNRVMTCSFHKFGEYFPGTGTQDDKGRGEGRGYALNVPFKDGLGDDSLKILQCGADSVAGDKLGCFNVTMNGHSNCVQFVRSFGIPFMMVGGGGYTVKNVARTWTYETACALGVEKEIDPVLPWNEYFEWFGPRYRLEVLPNNMEDLNVRDSSLNKVREIAMQQLQEITPAPSVALQDVPKESLGHHLGFSSHEISGHDRLDEQLAQHSRFVYNLNDSSSTSSDESSEYDSDASEYSQSRSRSRHVNKSTRTKRASRKAYSSGSYAQQNSHSAMTRGKKRMSIMTNQWVDALAYEFGLGLGLHMPSNNTLPSAASPTPSTRDSREGEREREKTGKTKRRFFESSARWDEGAGRVLVEHERGMYEIERDLGWHTVVNGRRWIESSGSGRGDGDEGREGDESIGGDDELGEGEMDIDDEES